MGRQQIRNPEAFAKSQAKKQRRFTHKVNAAKRSIPDALIRHFDGKLDRSSLDKAIDELLAKGAGGTPHGMRAIAHTLKHQQHAEEPWLPRDRQYDRDYAANVIDAALTELENEGRLTVTKSKRRIVIVVSIPEAASSDNQTPLVVTASDCEPVEPYDTYDPHWFVRQGIAKTNGLVFE